MKTALITGGAGFIGSHLCDFLLEKGYFVICMDNYATGKNDNIKHLLSNPNFKLVEQDITKYIKIYEKLDYILHFASPASPVDYQKIPIQTLKVGSLGTHNLLGLAKEKKAKFFLASTSEVYGDPLVHPQPESYWGNVNPVGPRSCFSSDTEILTKEGWKLLSEVNKKDVVLTLNNSTKKMEYHEPTEIIKERYIGQMIHFENSKIDLMVTPNHKMYVKPRGKKTFDLIKAYSSINWKRAEMQKSADWDGPYIKYFKLPSVAGAKKEFLGRINMDDWLEFMGYYLTEGCVHIRNRKQRINGKDYATKSYNILIAQDRKKVRERAKITACLKRLPFNFFDSDDHQFRICSKQLAYYLVQFGKSKERYIPLNFKNLHKKQIKILFEALMLGDGSKKGDAFYSNSYRMVGDFQEILLKSGMAGSIVCKDKRHTPPVYQLHTLTDKKKDFLTPKYPERKIVNYNGYVYCVNVKNHIILVRRNGKILFCGNCYDEAKRFAEAIVVAYHNIHKVDTKIARIFNTYGPRMRKEDGRVVPNFINQALGGKPLTVYGDGSQTRSFCYVSDLINGIYKLMVSDINEPVNLGNPDEKTVMEFAKIILKLTKSSSQIVFRPLPENDPKTRCPDITKAKKLLKWQPRISLEEGLSRTIEYFKQ